MNSQNFEVLIYLLTAIIFLTSFSYLSLRLAKLLRSRNTSKPCSRCSDEEIEYKCSDENGKVYYFCHKCLIFMKYHEKRSYKEVIIVDGKGKKI